VRRFSHNSGGEIYVTRILIENGKIKFDGKTADTLDVYQKRK
jgi:hypothetical protein